MALPHLTEEQVRTWTLEQKDRWWLANVYQGDMPQLTLRSALTGMLLGGILSLTNLYVCIRTGWVLGVGLSSVILSFAAWKALSRLGLGKEMTILENNAMQSIATSAGYMTGPLAGSIPAYMLVTGAVVPMERVYLWTAALAVLGVLFAFPLKKRFINDEQLPFPEGYAAGVVMDDLHRGHGQEGMWKAKLLLAGAGLSALVELLRSETILGWLRLRWLALPAHWDDLLYRVVTPRILGTPLKELTIQLDSSIVLLGTGGLMGQKTAASLMLGSLLNYAVLAPLLIREGVIAGTGFKAITTWALWGGVALMTTSSLYAFLGKPGVIAGGLRRLRGGSGAVDVLGHIELPLRVSALGIPVLGAAVVAMGQAWFGIPWWLGALAIPMVFVFTVIAVNSTGLTAITPSASMGKLTQVTYGVLAPGNVRANVMTAAITDDVALSASNLLMDIKPGYMLGAKPRQQALGHVLGVFAGGLVAIPVFYALFHGDLSLLTGEAMPLPGAVTWRAVAELLTGGLSTLHPTARVAVAVGAVLGLALEALDQKLGGRLPVSGVGLGLAFVIRFSDALSMSLGTLFFWLAGRAFRPGSTGHRALVQNQETAAAGIIAGGSIVGIAIVLLENLVGP